MDVPGSEHSHGNEVHDDRPLVQARVGGNRVCDGACCGFTDAKTSSEQSVSIKKLWVAIVLCIIFMCVEVVGGIRANSLAILTDAAHLISDVAAFAISLFSIWASGWEANPRHSYGFFRIEILGALVSIQMIWLLAGILVYEAIARLVHGTGEVQGFLMFSVSAFGFVVNIIMAFVLGREHGRTHNDHGQEDDDCFRSHGVTINLHQHHHQGNIKEDEHHCHQNESEHCEPLLGGEVKSCSVNEHKSSDPKQRNINIQGAYLHVLGDSIQSIGVMAGGGIIWYKPEWKYVDLICTLVFSVVVLCTTVKMLRNVLGVLMESTPKEVDATRLEKGLREMDEVVAVHELHIWAITVGKVLLACHVKITPEADPDWMLNKVIAYIKSDYKITHVTIQIERDHV